MNEPCQICQTDEWTVAYQGRIRDGVFGRYVDGTVWRCSGCGVESLPARVEDLDDYYRSEEYRKDVGEQPDARDYCARHDDEQFAKMPLLEGLPGIDKMIERELHHNR